MKNMLFREDHKPVELPVFQTLKAIYTSFSQQARAFHRMNLSAAESKNHR
jgi:hypothetical protein